MVIIMRYELPAQCPVCQEKMHVIRLGCDNCGSVLEGNFELDRLSRLSSEMRLFVVSFLKCRGNIREMEKQYNISYPTVRARIDEITASLGEHVSEEIAEDDDVVSIADNVEVDDPDYVADGDIEGSAEDDSNGDNVKLTRLEILKQLSDGTIEIGKAQELLGKINE